MRDSLAFVLEAAGAYRAVLHVSGVDFLARYEDQPFGCILLDINMPGLNGLEVQQRLNSLGSTMPLIVLTGYAEVGQAVQAMKAGARDFIEKPFDPALLFAALDAALGAALGPSAQDETARRAREAVDRLSPRERDVLAGLLQGHPNKVIAFHLGLSPRTVEIHRANMMHRLGVRSLSDAVRVGLAAGL